MGKTHRLAGAVRLLGAVLPLSLTENVPDPPRPAHPRLAAVQRASAPSPRGGARRVLTPLPRGEGGLLRLLETLGAAAAPGPADAGDPLLDEEKRGQRARPCVADQLAEEIVDHRGDPGLRDSAREIARDVPFPVEEDEGRRRGDTVAEHRLVADRRGNGGGQRVSLLPRLLDLLLLLGAVGGVVARRRDESDVF